MAYSFKIGKQCQQIFFRHLIIILLLITIKFSLKKIFINTIKAAFFFPVIPRHYTDEYRLDKYNSNNLRIFIISTVLFVEQLLLGIFLAEPGSRMQRTYFFSSAVMLVFAVIGFILLNRVLTRVKLQHEIFEILFAVFGMSIALGRMLLQQKLLTSLPTIYIAVLYGIAVLFIFNIWQSIFLYTILTVSAVILFPVFHPEIESAKFVTDIITNGIIAMVVVLLNANRFIISFLDKKKIETINKELREQTIRDGLTGLYNRRKLDEVLNEVCLKAHRYSNDFSVIMIDLDHFKMINDNYGHHVGDSVLTEFSRLLENNIRDVDVCGRWGGEEFLVICQETGLDAARYFAERLRQAVEVREFGGKLKITASFGVSAWDGCRDEESMLKDVDAMLYRAKEAGRNRVCAADTCD